MLTMIETVMGEARQTLRRLGREWGFVTAFVVTLALGIGANGAVFTALNSYLLQPLPYPHSERLANVYLGSHVLPFPKGVTSAYASQLFGKTPGIASWGLYRGGTQGGTATVLSNGEPKSVGAVSVTASLFKTLGVHPFLGRWIEPTSNRPGGPSEVVISYGFWQGALGGKADAIGQSVRIDGKQYTVVGVMPRGFGFPNRSIQLWRSMVLTSKDLSFARLTIFNWNMIVRRAPDVSQAQLSTALNTRLKRLAAQLPPQSVEAFKPYVGIIPLRQWFGGATGGQLLLMQLGAVLLLVLAAANLGNLALVRMLRRRHELGLRITLGASRLSLLRLTLIETLPLGFVAAVLGWFLSRVGAQVLAQFGIASSDTAFAAGAGGSVALFGVILSLIVAFIALSAPLLLVRSRHLVTLLKTGGRDAAGGKGSRRTRKGLSVVQIALAVMLLGAASLVGLSLQQMLNKNPGFNTDNLTVATVRLTGPAYDSQAQIAGAWRATQSAVASLPGVRAVGVADGIPFTGAGSVTAFRIASQGGPSSNPGLTSRVLVAGPGLLNTMDVRLLHGRLLNAADGQNDAHVVVVDEAFAQALFGTTNVVGRRLGSQGVDWRIVGVIATIKDDFTAGQSGYRGRVVVPASDSTSMWWGSSVQIVMRSSLPTSMVKSELQSAVAAALPGQAITRFSSMRGLMGGSAQGTSALATLLIAFGLLAFALASVGTYGVVAYLTRLRQREFAIRLTLGARPWQIEWLVLAQGVAMWATGAVLGIGCTILFASFLSGQLYGVSPLSPVAYIVPALALGIVVALASWLPARRVRRTALTETMNPQ